MHEVQLKDAKARLSAEVDRALAGDPVVITRHGRKEAVILSYQDWQRLTGNDRIPGFAELLLSFPGEPGDIPPRDKTRPREFDF